MKRPAQTEAQLIELLVATGPHGPSLEAKIKYLQKVRETSEGNEVDAMLVEKMSALHQGLLESQEHIKKAEHLLGELTSPPWFPATFLQAVPEGECIRAIVQHGNTQRVVGFAEGVDHASLTVGDEVFLSHELNVITAPSPNHSTRCGETASFDRKTADGRLVLKWHDDELVVQATKVLGKVELNAGDAVRFDRNLWLGFEKIERTEGQEYLLEEVPIISRERLGGQDENLDTLLSALTVILLDPAKATQYGLSGRNTILMVGPAGCGKTLMAKIAASEIHQMSGKKCRFAVVKPAEWESPWVGETQRNIRNCFKALGEAAEDGSAVLFLDEIEAIGRIRGSAVGHHSDKHLAALLAELNGFVDRKNVAIIAATNRKDLVDPALLERLSDVEINVGRPDMRGARAIFNVHLAPTLPYNPNGASSSATHRTIVETAVSKLYSPNAENEVCKMRFRDGKERTIAARELVSGRIFEQVCRSACRSAFLRDKRGGEPGIQVADMEEAVVQTLQRMRTMLTTHNAHAYLSDLPQDVDLVSVEPITRKVQRPHRYLNTQAA